MKLVILFVVFLLVGNVSADCLQYVHINNLLTEDDLGDMAFIYQNNNLSQRYIKEVNYTSGSFTVTCNTTYDIYIPPKPELILKNPSHDNWAGFMLFSFLGAIITILFFILLVIAIRGFWRK